MLEEDIAPFWGTRRCTKCELTVPAMRQLERQRPAERWEEASREGALPRPALVTPEVRPSPVATCCSGLSPGWRRTQRDGVLDVCLWGRRRAFRRRWVETRESGWESGGLLGVPESIISHAENGELGASHTRTDGTRLITSPHARTRDL